MNSFPIVTAHTGCMSHRDHSLASLRSAMALGADVYEEDIRVTRDGVLVFAHDDELILTNGQKASISSLAFSELNEHFDEDQLQPESALKWIKHFGKKMNLDVKTTDALEAALALVTKLDMVDDVFLSGCGYSAALEAARRTSPFRKLLNVDIGSFGEMSYSQAVIRACEEAWETDCFGLNIPYPLVRKELLRAAQREDLAVYVWTVAEEEDMRRLAGMGVDSITTREVGRLTKVRAEILTMKERSDFDQ